MWRDSGRDKLSPGFDRENNSRQSAKTQSHAKRQRASSLRLCDFASWREKFCGPVHRFSFSRLDHPLPALRSWERRIQPDVANRLAELAESRNFLPIGWQTPYKPIDISEIRVKLRNCKEQVMMIRTKRTHSRDPQRFRTHFLSARRGRGQEKKDGKMEEHPTILLIIKKRPRRDTTENRGARAVGEPYATPETIILCATGVRAQ